MRGPYPLSRQSVEIRVPPHVKGVYCLSKGKDGYRIIARAEEDLRESIKRHTHEYTMFWYEPALSDRECFTIECSQYHKCADTKSLADDVHPDAPPETDYVCPICGKK